jgi:hypothetical protein
MALFLECPKKRFYGAGTGAVDNARARRKGALGKHDKTKISP